MRLRNAAAKYWEFDRKGQVLYAHCQPGANRLRIQNFNSTLSGVYHHWNSMNDPFLGFTAQYWMKKVQGRWIYSPFEHLKLDTHLKPYKLWLGETLNTKPKVLKPEGYRFAAQYHAPIDNRWMGQNMAMAEVVRPGQIVDEVVQPAQGLGVRDLLRRARAARLDDDGNII